MLSKAKKKNRSKMRIRKYINGTASTPRFSVFRSNKQIYCQLVDDTIGSTLVSASSSEVKADGNKSDVAAKVGELLASKAKDKSIDKVVFDRNGYPYHGRVKALADSARKSGLKF